MIGTPAVADLAAVDPDDSDRAGFYLTNDAGGRFVMVGDKIMVADTSLLNYEAGTSHVIEVQRRRYGRAIADESITVSIGNVTGIGDNIVNGTSGAKTLNGSAAAIA